MIGPPPGSTHRYPSACGPEGPIAISALRTFLDGARALDIPVFYTQMAFRRDGADAGVYASKRGLPDTEGWFLEGSEGVAILDEVAPAPADLVLVKKKYSAFIGTSFAGISHRRPDRFADRGRRVDQ